MNELIEKVSGTSQTEEYSEFKIRKAARILKLIDLRYPSLFGGLNDIDEMIRQGSSSLARASIVELDGLDKRSTMLMFYSLLKGIHENMKKKGKSDSLKAMMLLPSLQMMRMTGKQAGRKEINSIMQSLEGLGIAFAIATEHLIDVDQEIKAIINAQINVVSENDIGVQLSNRKSYRVLLRPTLSKPAM